VSFNSRFVNEAKNDLIPGKIHTIRQNYNYWKKFEGWNLEFFTWDGKAYQKGSRQKVFCIKNLASVQKVVLWHNETLDGCKMPPDFLIKAGRRKLFPLSTTLLAINDGFDTEEEFIDWFYDYPDGKMAILHFTDFRYLGAANEKTGQ
jgi:hypothetical protein